MPLGVHPADPESPKGMAWVLSAGFPDPRQGIHPNQALVLIQGWEPWSELMWDFGLRWHPELQTKWVTGGGQFSVGDIHTEKPAAEPTLEAAADEFLDMVAEEQPEFVAEIRRLRDEGTPEERLATRSDLRKNIEAMRRVVEYLDRDGS